MKKYLFIFLILATSVFPKENRLFWDGREWKKVIKKSNYDENIEYKIKSAYVNGVLDGKLKWYLKTWSKDATLANEVFDSKLDYLTVREIINSLNYFYEDPLNSYIPVPSAIVIANLYGMRVPLETIEQYISETRDWVNSLIIELDTLNYDRLLEDKFQKYKPTNK